MSHKEPSQGVFIEQFTALSMQGIEQRYMNGFEHAELLGGVKSPGVYFPIAGENCRDPDRFDVVRFFFEPGLDGRLKGITMRASVPEQFNHLDFAGC